MPLSAFATHPLDHRRHADGALQRLPVHAHQRRRRARATARVRPWPKWSSWPPSCRRALASNGPASRARKSWPARRPWCSTASPSWRCSCAWPRCTKAGRFRWPCILVVPLGVLGVLLATLLRGYANDVYFQVGLVTIIGLSAKNAILIIEFAKDLQAQGKSVVESALAAAHLRFRPIVMTSHGLHAGRAAAGPVHGRGLGQPARHRHRRDRRHDHRHRAGRVLRAGVLRAWCAACSRAASASSKFDAEHAHQTGGGRPPW